MGDKNEKHAKRARKGYRRKTLEKIHRSAHAFFELSPWTLQGRKKCSVSFEVKIKIQHIHDNQTAVNANLIEEVQTIRQRYTSGAVKA